MFNPTKQKLEFKSYKVTFSTMPTVPTEPIQSIRECQLSNTTRIQRGGKLRNSLYGPRSPRGIKSFHKATCTHTHSEVEKERKEKQKRMQ